MKTKEKKSFWVVSDINEKFNTLQEAKSFCSYGFTEKERIKFLHGEEIAHFVNCRLVSLTKIWVNEQGYCVFSRTKSLKITY